MVPGKLAKSMKTFITQVNKVEQTERDIIIDKFCQQMEKDVYDAIRDIQIIILPGTIQVQGSPGAQANIVPIILKNGAQVQIK